MQTYLITGAAQGLGKALTQQLVKQGHQVILLDKELTALNKLYDELDSDLAALYPLDLLGAKIDHYQTLQDVIAKAYGKLTGVILNATIMPTFTPIEQFNYTQWYQILHTNLNANFHLIQTTLPLLTDSKNTHLLAVLDNNIKKHPAYYGAYGVAKAGLEQLMISVAAEHTNTNLNVYCAKLETFATKTRSRLFPGENPLNLISAETQAKRILQSLTGKNNHTSIKRL